MINKHPTDDLKVEIEINGFRPDPEGSATVLTARTLNSYNTPEHPNAVTLTSAPTFKVANHFTYIFPAHSATLLELEREE